MDFILAERDTIAAAISWFFWLLSENPMAETKILDGLGEQPSSSFDG